MENNNAVYCILMLQLLSTKAEKTAVLHPMILTAKVSAKHVQINPLLWIKLIARCGKFSIPEEKSMTVGWSPGIRYSSSDSVVGKVKVVIDISVGWFCRGRHHCLLHYCLNLSPTSYSRLLRPTSCRSRRLWQPMCLPHFRCFLTHNHTCQNIIGK